MQSGSAQWFENKDQQFSCKDFIEILTKNGKTLCFGPVLVHSVFHKFVVEILSQGNTRLKYLLSLDTFIRALGYN